MARRGETKMGFARDVTGDEISQVPRAIAWIPTTRKDLDLTFSPWGHPLVIDYLQPTRRIATQAGIGSLFADSGFQIDIGIPSSPG